MSQGFDDLDFRLAHMTRDHERLDEVVTEQGRTIEALGRLLKEIQERLGALESLMRSGEEGGPQLLDGGAPPGGSDSVD